MNSPSNIKNTLTSARSALSLLMIFSILLGGVYPLLVTAIAQVAFHDKANGSLIESLEKYKDEPETIGSSLLGQEFTENKYFWGRPSAKNYDTMESAGSNLSPANPKLLEVINLRVTKLRKADPSNKAKIPVDLVTASASGLDPHISLLAAEYQIDRIAKERDLKPDEVQAIIIDHISEQSKLFGEPYVNVLELNLALDKGRYSH